MKKNIFLMGVAVFLLAVLALMVGCGSTPKNNGEPTPFEGEWINVSPHTQDPNRMVQMKYTFAGKTFILGSDAHVNGLIQNLAKGNFTYTATMMRLDSTHMGTSSGRWMRDRFEFVPTILYDYEFDNENNLILTNESGSFTFIKQ